jgi:hypothetical protein
MLYECFESYAVLQLNCQYENILLSSLRTICTTFTTDEEALTGDNATE